MGLWVANFNRLLTSKLHDMKNLFLFLMCLITCNSIHAQKIVKDEIDEFTGNRITETNTLALVMVLLALCIKLIIQ